MNRFLNYRKFYIKDLNFRRKVLGPTILKLKQKDITINPLLISNTILIDSTSNSYLSDRLSIIVDAISNDSTMKIGGYGGLGRNYTIEHTDSELSIFSKNRRLKVTLSNEIKTLISMYKPILTNKKLLRYVVLFYIAEYINKKSLNTNIAIYTSESTLTSTLYDNERVLFINKGGEECDRGKLTKETIKALDVLREAGNAISYEKPMRYKIASMLVYALIFARYSYIKPEYKISNLKESSSQILSEGLSLLYNDNITIDDIISINNYIDAYIKVSHISNKFIE